MFIEEYLKELRRDRFSPAALVRYARRVAGRVREGVIANPGAVRSMWSLALVFFALDFAGAAVLALQVDRDLALDWFLWTALAIVVVFGLVTCGLDLMRDRDGYRLSGVNVPTALTLLRATLVPGIVLALVDRRLGLAVSLYAVAGLSDVADGWIARRTRQITALGTALDPLVDIAFNLAVLAGLAAAGLLAPWVLAMGVLRYGILLVGGAGLYLFVGPVRIQPTWFGRLTGVVMALFVGLLVLLHALQGHLAARLGALTEIALGLLLGATVVQVVALGWYNLRLMTRAPDAGGRVVEDVRWRAR